MKTKNFLFLIFSFLLALFLTAVSVPVFAAACPSGSSCLSTQPTFPTACGTPPGTACSIGSLPGCCSQPTPPAPAAGSTAGAAAGTTGVSLFNPLGASSTLSSFIGKVIGGIMGLVGTIALLMFVWGGIQYLISQGSPDKIKSAKSTLIYASLGLVVIFTSYTLVSALVKVLSSGKIE